MTGDVLVTITVLVTEEHITGELKHYFTGTNMEIIADHIVATALDNAGLNSNTLVSVEVSS